MTDPSWVHELLPAPDPAACCEILSPLPFRCFLDSATHGRLGRHSFLSADPVAIVRAKGRAVEIVRDGRSTGTDEAALDVIRRLLGPVRPHRHDLPPFQGGAAGYVAYDWGRTLERLPECRHDDLAMPDLALGLFDWVIAWDHDQGRAWLISTGLGGRSSPQETAARRGDAIVRALSGERLPSATAAPIPQIPERGGRAASFEIDDGWWDERLRLRSSFSRRGYLEAIELVRELIRAGDIFQANLSQRFEADLHEPPWDYYRRLRTRNAAPFAAFLDLPGVTVMSASPERFLRVDERGRVETRPIKGTRPRGIGPEHDAHLGRALTESGKDQAENLMIVDLMRNDLSRVCLPGSVRVPELFALERYATVHHLVSTVVGELAPGEDPLTLMAAAFPGGSVTGAPKIRAMEVIAELEPSERGVYCGAIGYWSCTGTMDTSVAIRTAVARHGRITFSAGGGIVADSESSQEYRETLDKARGMIDALAADGPADR